MARSPPPPREDPCGHPGPPIVRCVVTERANTRRTSAMGDSVNFRKNPVRGPYRQPFALWGRSPSRTPSIDSSPPHRQRAARGSAVGDGSRHEVRQERRRPHRVQGLRRRPVRPRPRTGYGVARGALLGASHQRLPAEAARLVRASDRLRQARTGACPIGSPSRRSKSVSATSWRSWMQRGRVERPSTAGPKAGRCVSCSRPSIRSGSRASSCTARTPPCRPRHGR